MANLMFNYEKTVVFGAAGMVGSAILRELQRAKVTNVKGATRADVDLSSQEATREFMRRERPDCVILAAAKVGGIRANMNDPVGFLQENLKIQSNVIESSAERDVKQIVFLASSCIYPRDCAQPMEERMLLTGPFEPTNEGYAIAKLAGIRLLQYYKRQYGKNSIILSPCNLYGPNDSFDLESAHVLSSLVRRFSDAKKAKSPRLTLWGTGYSRREFMHVDDLARAVRFFLQNHASVDFTNVGPGQDISIHELATLIGSKVGYAGEIAWDNTKPDGMPRKCTDITRMVALGFRPQVALEQGVEQMIQLYRSATLRDVGGCA